MIKKGVETFKAVMYTTFFVVFSLFLLVVFLQVGAKEKGDILSALNSDMANRIANSVNLIQTYNTGSVEIDLPGKYIVRRSEKMQGDEKLHYIEVAYKSEINTANSKAFKLNPEIEVYPSLEIHPGKGTMEFDVSGDITTKKNPGSKICIIKEKNKIYLFDMDHPTYVIPNEIDVKKCALK